MVYHNHILVFHLLIYHILLYINEGQFVYNLFYKYHVLLFYNLNYFITNPIEIFFIWNGGMSFHGGLLGIIFATIYFAKKKGFDRLVLLDVVACVAPVGIFFGRLANFINGELYGKPTVLPWGVIFTKIDEQPRHPSQIYEAFLEGFLLFILLNIIINKKNYQKGMCAALFLVFYSFQVLAV